MIKNVPIIAFIACIMASAFVGACSGSVMAPAAVHAEGQMLWAPQHNNIQATFKGQEGGPMIWLCATQPRPYVNSAGTSQMEEDHYLQYEPCPLEVVK